MENNRPFNSEKAAMKAVAFQAKIFGALALLALSTLVVTAYILRSSPGWAVVGALPMAFLCTMCVSEVVYNVKVYRKKKQECQE